MVGKIDWSKPIETMYGRPVEMLRELNSAPGVGRRYAVLYIDECGNESVTTVTEDYRGEFFRNKKSRGVLEGWINLYPDGSTSSLYRERKIADRAACSTRIACLRIIQSWEEGDGL